MHDIGVSPDQETYINYVFPSFNNAKSARAVLQVSTRRCGFNFIIKDISFLPNCLVITKKKKKVIKQSTKNVIVQFSKAL